MIGTELDISYAALELTVLEGFADLRTLKIFSEKKIVLEEGVELHAAIIGTSHFVKFTRNEECFIEMLACDPKKGYGGKEVKKSPIVSMREPFSFSTKLVDYSFSHAILDYKKSYDNVSEKWEQLRMENPLVHLSHEFNKDTNLPSARTLLSVVQDESGYRVFTAHEYQEDNKVVLSESLISIHA